MPGRLPPRFGRSQGRRTILRVVGGEVGYRFGGIDTDDLIEYLEDLKLRMIDLQPVFERYGEYIVGDHIPNQFAAQGTPRGWAALSPAYARWKAVNFPGMPLLQRTGRMKRGFSFEARPRSLRVINRVTAGQSTNIPRWRFHQEGTSRMPARPMLQFTNKDRDKMHEFVEAYLREALLE